MPEPRSNRYLPHLRGVGPFSHSPKTQWPLKWTRHALKTILKTAQKPNEKRRSYAACTPHIAPSKSWKQYETHNRIKIWEENYYNARIIFCGSSELRTNHPICHSNGHIRIWARKRVPSRQWRASLTTAWRPPHRFSPPGKSKEQI